MISRFAVGSAIVLFACSAAAADVPSRILLPLGTFANIPGAFGSSWTSTFVGRTEESPADITQVVVGGGCIGNCTIPAHTTFRLAAGGADVNRGAFLYVAPAAAANSVSFTLRIQDVSRQTSTWGTSLPVVRESDTRSGTIELLDIPLNNRFRVALRVYDFDSDSDRAVRLRIYYPVAQFDATPVVDVVLPLERSAQDTPPEFPAVPSSLFIGNLYDRFPELMAQAPPQPPAAKRIRVQLDAATQGLRYWAFASVTNNETQHVTVVLPR